MTVEAAVREKIARCAGQNPYRPVRCRVEQIVEETPTIKTFVLRPEKPVPFLAGQFMEVSLPGIGEAPFTPSSSPTVADRLEFTIMKAGMVTERLHAIAAGTELGVRGPLGTQYPLDTYAGKPLLILGGGVGLAPLRALLYALFAQQQRFPRILICYGARTPADLVYRRMYEEWSKMPGVEFHVTIDRAAPGWDGNVGVVTTLLDKVSLDPKNTNAVVCGPPIMMRFGTLELLKHGFATGNIYLSMEKNMSCGIGKCGHCRIGPYFACKDGPVFAFKQIEHLKGIWD